MKGIIMYKIEFAKYNFALFFPKAYPRKIDEGYFSHRLSTK
jgi:hypothetical protein